MAFCPNCGTKVEPEGALFCTNCGTKLAQQTTPQVSTSAAPPACAEVQAAPTRSSAKRKGAPVPPAFYQEQLRSAASVPASAQAQTQAQAQAETSSAPTRPLATAAPLGSQAPAAPQSAPRPAMPLDGQPDQTLEASAQVVYGQQGSPSVPHDPDLYSNIAAAEKLLGDTPGQVPVQPQKTAVSKNVIRLVIVLVICLVFILVQILIFRFLLPSGTQENNPVSESSGQSQTSIQSENHPTKAENVLDVKPKSSISEYSWEEINAISSLISQQARSKEQAISIAAKYNLCLPDGTLKNDVITARFKPSGANKPIDLGFLLVGIFQDQRPEGGPAPLSFMCTQAIGGGFLELGDQLNFVAGAPMNPTNTNAGGWEGSAMRTWLNGAVLAGLEEDLQDNIKPVIKLTNNSGKTKDPISVTTTIDSLYLFSWKELLGDISWNKGVSTSYIDTVDNAEGRQYDYFVQQGVRGDQGAPVLRRALYRTSDSNVTYWMRSSAPNTDTSFGDMGPTLNNGGLASTPEYVVFGFCI